MPFKLTFYGVSWKVLRYICCLEFFVSLQLYVIVSDFVLLNMLKFEKLGFKKILVNKSAQFCVG